MSPDRETEKDARPDEDQGAPWFQGFARVWTAVALSRELPMGRPLAVRVAGTPLVLFRDDRGAPTALVDRCPHRGVALSLGAVRGGCIECPFHGWRIDGKGAVVEVPWNPDAKLDRLRGTALPVREIGGHVFVFTDVSGAPPPSEPEVHGAFTRPGVSVTGTRVTWAVHWTRAMENMLDSPHLPFVHKKTIGKGMVGKTNSRMDVAWEDRPWGAHTYIEIDGARQQGSLDYRWPNQMNLHIPVKGKLFMMLVACVPIDDARTAMLLTMARGFLTSRIFDGFFHRTNAKIANEDRAIVESSFPSEVPPAAAEKSVRTDGPTLTFRKRYFAELKGSSSGVVEAPDGKRALPMAAPLDA